jgi:ribosomal protein L37AE/L43A
VRGRVVDVRDVIAMWPNIEDLREYGHPLDFDPKALATGLFDRSSFDTVFRADLDQAKRGIAIYAPFVTLQRVAAYEALFRQKTAERIAIRCVTRPPVQNGSIPADDAKDALDSLEAMGCTVDTRWEIHQQVVVVDDEIIWFGSLNPLSPTSGTNETMLRVISKPGALQMAVFLSVTGKRSPDHAESLAFLGENPKCPGCKARTTYRMGKWGPYWECESRCGWTEGLKPNRAQRPAAGNEDRPTNAPMCPKCKAQTVLRRGRYGQFWSCSRFPVCDGLVEEHRERKTGTQRRPAR